MNRTRSGLLAVAAAVLWLAASAIYLAFEEVPTAVLSGKAVTEEGGQPLKGAVIRLHMGAAPGGSPEELVIRTRQDGTFRPRRIPAGSYLMEASSRAHTLAMTHLMLAEGETRTLTLELAPVPPFFDLRMPERVFTPDETPKVSVHGFTPHDTIDFRFYRVDAALLYSKYSGQLRQLLVGRSQSEQVPEIKEGQPGLVAAGKYSAHITQRDLEGVFHQRFELPVQRPGLYVIEATSESKRELAWMSVSRLGMIVKHWGTDALTYVADLKTGTPVAGAQVTLLPEGKPPVSGVTDAQGLFRTAIAKVAAPPAPDEEGGGGESLTVVAHAEKDGSDAFLQYWQWNQFQGRHRAYVYTDRPVYRPGHRTYFNGIVRELQGEAYARPKQQAVSVEVKDPRESVIYRKSLTTDAYGSFHGDLDLSDEAATGYYSVQTRVAGEVFESGFKVAEYRKPEYSVEVKTEKKRYTRGEEIQTRIQAEYYFGAPVAGAEVKYSIMRSPYYYFPETEGIYAWGEEGEDGYYDYGEVVQEGTAKTDEQGVANLSLPTKASFSLLKQQNASEESGDQRYVISVTVTDPSRKEAQGEGSVIVTEGEFNLDAEPASYVVQPGSSTAVRVLARDYEGKPVSKVRFDAVAESEDWTGKEITYHRTESRSGTTDAQGRAEVTLTPPEAGQYRIRVTATDGRGNHIRTDAYLWVTGEDYADFGVQYPELEIITDRKNYRKGDTVTALINTQRKGATALLTVEGPHLYETRLVVLKGSSTRVTVPIRPEYAPNFFISVALVHNKQFATQEKQVLVSVADRKLAVEVKPDKSKYAPGDRATYTIFTRDQAGHPVQAEASLGVVDESLYAVQSESTPPMLQFFYPPRGNSVSTDYSFPSLYLDANKEPVGVKVRRKFPDTAYWNPTVITGPEGRATVSFTMPDTLTTWRATLRAATLDTAVGEAVAKVTTSKDLIVRLETPRFFTQNDRLTISALVHNYSGAAQDLRLWIEAPGLLFDGSRRAPAADTFSLKAGDMKRRDWTVTVPDMGAKEITVRVQSQTNPKLQDGMALTIPALPHGRARVEVRGGSVKETLSERFTVRRDAVPGTGDLRVRLAPSLASVLLGSLDYLAHYPYGCTEQTMSAFLPDIVVGRALTDLKLPNQALQARLPRMVQRGLDRLYGYQHEDGGWGWWRYDETDRWMTAYVVFGLTLAKQDGYPVNDASLARGLDQLVTFVKAPVNRPNDELAFLAYVLSQTDRRSAALPLLDYLYARADQLDTGAQARLTLALLSAGRAPQAKLLAAKLWGRATETQAMLSWASNGTGWESHATDSAETTALAFQALFALSPDDPRLEKAVRWLLLNRRDGCWESTRDTAFVLFAVTGYLKRSQETTPDYTMTVALNGKTLLTRHVTKADLLAPETEVRVAGRDLKSGDNSLAFTKSGPGTLYYNATFSQYVGQEDVTELVTGAGITVTREYFRLQSSRNRETGVIATAPAPDPSTDFASGEPILVRLTVNSAKRLEYMVVEDPLPSGAEVIERGDLALEEWDNWYSDIDVRDEKVAFFARALPAGKSTFEYHLRPQVPGEYHVMPTTTYDMYAPELRGSGRETRVRIK